MMDCWSAETRKRAGKRDSIFGIFSKLRQPYEKEGKAFWAFIAYPSYPAKDPCANARFVPASNPIEPTDRATWGPLVEQLGLALELFASTGAIFGRLVSN